MTFPCMSQKNTAAVSKTYDFNDDLCFAFQNDNSIKSVQLGAQFKLHHTIIPNALRRTNLTYAFNRWLHHQLTQNNNKNTQKLLQMFHRTVTGDEKCVYYNNTSGKAGWSEPVQPGNVYQ